ncbi:MAG: GTP 3',8-cyclase MoaA [Eubacteriales bacterium]|nr:GTP 3',8-cyclase MoaA [Eubacteriales bacterium]
MKDIFNRTIEYLRISITDRCNFRCVYCMPEEGVEYIEHDEILNFDEIVRICRIGVGLGIKKIKITGGEPLVRRDAVPLIARIKSIAGIEEVTLTTNGLLLERHIPALREIGIDGINISLDAVEPAAFERITRFDKVETVLSAIRASVAAGIKTKVNALIMPGVNEDQIIPLAELARETPVHVRFIEVMPIGMGKDKRTVSPDDIRTLLGAEYGRLQPEHEKLGNGPATYYRIPGFAGRIGFIAAVSHCFCEQCNRVRLTSTGFLKACLQYSYGIELKPLLRGDYPDEVVAAAMREIIFRKPKEHQFNRKFQLVREKTAIRDCGYNPELARAFRGLIHEEDAEMHHMSSIGG